MIAPHFLGAAIENHSSFVQHDDSIGNPFYFVEQMR
jgi:hypothetical protein